MGDFINQFFSGQYMPHGYCYQWQPGILWINVLSDLFIALAYFSIPLILVLLIKKRPELKFKGIFVLFAAFILLCGMTHLFAIYTVWHGTYGIHGVAKALTAIISLSTVWVLFRQFPALLALPTPAQLKNAEEIAINEKQKNQQLEKERKAEAIFRFSLELLPTGLLVVDSEQNIRIANQAIEKMFGYSEDELKEMQLSQLIHEAKLSHHAMLVDLYMENPSNTDSTSMGRLVKGITKSGEQISLEVSLSLREFEGEKLAFASIANVDRVISQKELFFESSNRIRRAVDATNDGIWEWNIQTNDAWFSQQFMNMTGQENFKQPHVINQWKSHIHPDDLDSVETKLAVHFQEKTLFEAVYRGKNADNGYQWMQVRGNTIFDQENLPILMSGTLTNINTVKTLELQLADKTQFLDAVINKSLCGMYIFNVKTRKNVFINSRYTEITGYLLNELHDDRERKKLSPLFHPDDREKVDRHIATLISRTGPTSSAIEYRFRHKDDYWIWCLSKDSVYSYDNEGNVQEIIGTFFDVTELKNRENEVRSLALDFVTTFEQAAVGIAHVSLDGKWLKVNKKLCEILAYSPKEMMNTTFNDLCLSEDRDIDLDDIQQLIEHKKPSYSLEKRYTRSDSTVIWVNLTVSLVQKNDGTNSHFIFVIEDISKRKNTEQALADSNAALERFAYSASHDLQEPLRKISAFSDSLTHRLKDKVTDKNAIYELDRISHSALRMREMINSLLQLSRYTTKSIAKEKILLSDILNIAKDDISTILTENNVQITLEKDVELLIDIGSFEQVLSNLIINSIRYAKPDRRPQITLSSTETKDTVKIIFSDNGIGFNEKYVGDIFKPFKRLVGRKIPGHGMGLAICHKIILAHGGKISASSQENHGATFTITLPKENSQND